MKEESLAALTEREISIEADTAEEAARTYQDKFLQAKLHGKDMTVFSPERYLLAHSVEVTAKAIHKWLLPTRGTRKSIGEAYAAKKIFATENVSLSNRARNQQQFQVSITLNPKEIDN